MQQRADRDIPRVAVDMPLAAERAGLDELQDYVVRKHGMHRDCLGIEDGDLLRKGNRDHGRSLRLVLIGKQSANLPDLKAADSRT
jgi:hypothetical protein